LNLKEYQELMTLLDGVTSRTSYLPKLFGTRYPSGQQVDLQIAQKKALRDIDTSWEKFKQRAKELNAWNDEAKQNPLI
jgi:hypothetical protein